MLYIQHLLGRLFFLGRPMLNGNFSTAQVKHKPIIASNIGFFNDFGVTWKEATLFYCKVCSSTGLKSLRKFGKDSCFSGRVSNLVLTEYDVRVLIITGRQWSVPELSNKEYYLLIITPSQSFSQSFFLLQLATYCHFQIYNLFQTKFSGSFKWYFILYFTPGRAWTQARIIDLIRLIIQALCIV